MTSKERLLCALHRGKPDRLPASVHQWQQYHLDTFMGGVSALEAFRLVGMDAEIQHVQEGGQYWASPETVASYSTPEWREEFQELDSDPDHRVLRHTIRTPKGELGYVTEANRKTIWVIEHMIKRDEDVELIERYMPAPTLDLQEVARQYDEVGDDGILRGMGWGDQAGCWQHACCLMDTTELILKCFDDPSWVHRLLGALLERKLRFVESMSGARFDLIETGGGAASSTVISPDLHKEFCLPYDRQLHDALHAHGFLVTYHTCGGTLGIEEHIVANGCDASETLAPVSIGSNQEPWDLKRKIGDRVALIGGVDQFSVLTDGPTEKIRATVHDLFHRVGQDGGYICSASDHFFDTPVEHLKAFADAARECAY